MDRRRGVHPPGLGDWIALGAGVGCGPGGRDACRSDGAPVALTLRGMRLRVVGIARAGERRAVCLCLRSSGLAAARREQDRVAGVVYGARAPGLRPVGMVDPVCQAWGPAVLGGCAICPVRKPPPAWTDGLPVLRPRRRPGEAAHRAGTSDARGPRRNPDHLLALQVTELASRAARVVLQSGSCEVRAWARTGLPSGSRDARTLGGMRLGLLVRIRLWRGEGWRQAGGSGRREEVDWL